MRSTIRSSLPAAVLLLLAAPDALADEPFQDLDVPTTLALAEKEDRVALLFFHDPASSGSRRMLQESFGDAGVREWIDQHAVAVSFLAENDQATRRFNVSSFPTTVLLRPDGGLLHRILGHQDPVDLRMDLETALLGVGEVEEPAGEDAENPVAWLAWANWLFANDPTRAEECTEAYLYCLDRGDEHLPGFRERYLDFLLERLSYLKAHTAVAIDALLSRRDALSIRIEDGSAPPRQVHEYTRFNYWLRDQDLTVELFLKLGQYDTPEHEAARHILLQEELKRIVDGRNYDVVLEMVPDPVATIDADLRAYGGSVEERGKDVSERAGIVDDAANYYECLLFAGRGADAQALLDRVAADVPTGRTFYAFHERSNRLGLYSVSRATLAKGLEKVKGERGRGMLQRAAELVPDEEDDGQGASSSPRKGGDGGER